MPRAKVAPTPSPEPAARYSAGMLHVIRTALGMDDPPRRNARPRKNRTAFNIRNEGILTAAECEGYGLLIQDRAEHYGKMRVFRVTRAGFEAVGVGRPRADLLELAIRAANAALAADQISMPFEPEAA